MPKADFPFLLRGISRLWSRGSSLTLEYAFAPFPGNEVLYEPLEMELLLSDCGFLVYEHPDAAELVGRYFRENVAAPSALLLPAVRCLLAVRQ